LRLLSDDDDDKNSIAMQLSIKFDADTRVAFIDSKELSFKRAKEFVFTITITADAYLIEVNGEFLYSLRHRLNFRDITRLVVFNESKQLYLRSVNYSKGFLRVTNQFEVSTVSGSSADKLKGKRKARFLISHHDPGNELHPWVLIQNVKYSDQYLAVSEDSTKLITIKSKVNLCAMHASLLQAVFLKYPNNRERKQTTGANVPDFNSLKSNHL
jgi:hypothetical protein